MTDCAFIINICLCECMCSIHLCFPVISFGSNMVFTIYRQDSEQRSICNFKNCLVLSVRFKLFLINFLEVWLQTQFRAKSKVSSTFLSSPKPRLSYKPQLTQHTFYVYAVEKKQIWKYQRQGLPVRLVLYFHQIKLKDNNIV